MFDKLKLRHCLVLLAKPNNRWFNGCEPEEGFAFSGRLKYLVKNISLGKCSVVIKIDGGALIEARIYCNQLYIFTAFKENELRS